MNEIELVTDLLREYEGMEGRRVELVGGSFGELSLKYQIWDEDGRVWLGKMYRQVQEDWFFYFYPWAREGIEAWLMGRAEMLCFLEQQGYMAPRVLRTRAGEVVACAGERCMLITSFVEGVVLKPTLEQLRLLGETVGRLHSLRVEREEDEVIRVGESYWGGDVLARVEAELVAVEGRLPEGWRRLHGEFLQTIRRLRGWGEQPRTVIHGDMWAANAVQGEDGRVVLIDWEGGGLGPAVFDLGRLLLECHLDSDLPPGEPLAWHIAADEGRIRAVVDGYARGRRLGEVELEMLLEAIRFGIVFVGALHFRQSLKGEKLTEEWVRGMQRRFERLRNRWEVSVGVAEMARRRFEQGRS